MHCVLIVEKNLKVTEIVESPFLQQLKAFLFDDCIAYPLHVHSQRVRSPDFALNAHGLNPFCPELNVNNIKNRRRLMLPALE